MPDACKWCLWLHNYTTSFLTSISTPQNFLLICLHLSCFWALPFSFSVHKKVHWSRDDLLIFHDNKKEGGKQSFCLFAKENINEEKWLWEGKYFRAPSRSFLHHPDPTCLNKHQNMAFKERSKDQDVFFRKEKLISLNCFTRQWSKIPRGKWIN